MTIIGKYKNNNLEFPLWKTDVIVDTVDDVAMVSLNQTYFNNTNKRIHSYYRFPLYIDANVCECTIKFKEGKIVCRLSEIEAAKKTYADAVASGNKAVLMTENSQEDYDISIGNIDSHETVVVSIKYLLHLKRDVDDKRLFILPTTIAPKYDKKRIDSMTFNKPFSKVRNPPSLYNRDESGLLFGATPTIVSHEEQRNEHEEEEEEKIIFEEAAEKSPVNIKIHVLETKGLEHVILPSWERKLTLRKKLDRFDFHCEVEGLILEKDFVMKIIPDDFGHLPEPEIWAEKYISQDQDKQQHPYTLKLSFDEKTTFKIDEDARYEFIIMIDRSASMQGKQMNNAKCALHTLLQSLPMDSYFNIYGFGSTWKRFYPSSVKYTQETYSDSQKLVDTIEANLGGTELYDVLKSIYESNKIENYKRRILLITDGETSDNTDVFSLVQKDKDVSIFTIGVGDSVSHELVNGLAERTNGFCEVIANADLIEQKVLKQLQRAMFSTTLINISGLSYFLSPGQQTLFITADTLDPEYIEICLNNNEISHIVRIKWTDELLHRDWIRDDDVYSQYDETKQEQEEEHGEQTLESKTSETYETDRPSSYPLRIQWANNEIKKLMIKEEQSTSDTEREIIRKMIVDLSINYHILSKYTSFVSVSESDNKEVANEIFVTPLHPGQYANGKNSEKALMLYKQGFYTDAMQWGINDDENKPKPKSKPKLRFDKSFPRQQQHSVQYSKSTEKIDLSLDYSQSHKISKIFSEALQYNGCVSSSILFKYLIYPENTEIGNIPNDIWTSIIFIAYMTKMNMYHWRMTVKKTQHFIEQQPDITPKQIQKLMKIVTDYMDK